MTFIRIVLAVAIVVVVAWVVLKDWIDSPWDDE